MLVEACPNLRDLGGICAGGGMVRFGRLIRAGAIYPAPSHAFDALALIGIFDMRSESEKSYHPDPVIRGAAYRHIEVMRSGRRELANFKRDVSEKVHDILQGRARGEGIASLRMVDIYRRMIFSEEMHRCLYEIVSMLADEPEGAVLWHCAAGKDRTGVMAAILLRLLGASDDAIYKDYLYTNTALAHEIREAYALARKVTGEEAAAQYVKGFFTACPCWLAAALGAMERDFGTAEHYAMEAAGLTKWQLEAFQKSCIV